MVLYVIRATKRVASISSKNDKENKLCCKLLTSIRPKSILNYYLCAYSLRVIEKNPLYFLITTYIK